ncbi:MAG: hypothetical protein HYW15_00580 [Candidatus Giovannonibacteria bacterium]|nr:MAG: hypothetical protein HYW15_00580 [Candidatus Giovannonibacteria bacterium]
MTAQIKQEEIIAKYQELPEDLQKALVSSFFSNAITDAGKKFGLAIDKIGELAEETGFVMLGVTPPSEYVKNLTGRLGVAPEKARAIAEEINQKVFQPVRESLKKIHGLGGSVLKPLPKREDIIAPPTPPSPPPYQGGDKGEVIPSIFVKNIPPPVGEFAKVVPDILPAKQEPLPPNHLAAKSALEKDLNAPAPKQKPQYEKDPYREQIE